MPNRRAIAPRMMHCSRTQLPVDSPSTRGVEGLFGGYWDQREPIPRHERGGAMEDARLFSMRFGLFGIVVIAVAGSPGFVLGQTESYPSRPVRVIVPFPPGGSLDFNARAIVDKFTDSLGQQVVIDNRGGASGTIGTGIVARSAP